MTTDPELVERARRGDTAAFEATIAPLGDRLLAVAFRIMRDLDVAEDCVQSAMISAWRDLPRLRDVDRFDAWMRRMVVNACYVQHRRSRRQAAAVSALRLIQPEPDLVAGVVDRDALDRAFRKLPIDQRVVLTYRYHLGFQIDAIADELSIPVGTVKSRLHYAMAGLRAALDVPDRTTATRTG